MTKTSPSTYLVDWHVVGTVMPNANYYSICFMLMLDLPNDRRQCVMCWWYCNCRLLIRQVIIDTYERSKEMLMTCKASCHIHSSHKSNGGVSSLIHIHTNNIALSYSAPAIQCKD